MHRKLLSPALVFLLIHTVVGVEEASAQTDAEKQARLVEKIKGGISRQGVGRKSRVSVKLKDKSKLTGYISEVRDDSFVVTDLKTGAATTVAYSDVRQVSGNNLSTRAKIIIGASIGGAAVFVVFLILLSQLK